MLQKRIRLSFTRSRVALLASLLVLWLSFASIAHQFDTSLIPHHHDCQAFSLINHGLSQSSATTVMATGHLYVEPAAQVIKISRVHLAYSARSPPYDS
jgi:hypothetical protein